MLVLYLTAEKKAWWCNPQIITNTAHRVSIYNVSLAGTLPRSARLRFGCLGSLHISERMSAHGPKSRIQELNRLLHSCCSIVLYIYIMNLSHFPSSIPTPFSPPSFQYVPTLGSCLSVSDYWDWLQFLAWAWVGGYLLEQGQFVATPGGKLRRLPSNHKLRIVPQSGLGATWAPPPSMVKCWQVQSSAALVQITHSFRDWSGHIRAHLPILWLLHSFSPLFLPWKGDRTVPFWAFFRTKFYNRIGFIKLKKKVDELFNLIIYLVSFL